MTILWRSLRLIILIVFFSVGWSVMAEWRGWTEIQSCLYLLPVIAALVADIATELRDWHDKADE